MLLHTTPLASQHSIRGVGVYTKFLLDGLNQSDEVTLLRSNDSPTIKPDVIHFPWFDFFYASLPLQLATPLVVTIHDTIPLIYPKYYPPGKKGRLASYWQRFALSRVSAVITDSECSKRDIIKFFKFPESKTHVVHLAANPAINPDNLVSFNDLKQTYNLPKTYILYVGDINYNKNIPQLVKTLKFLPRHIHLICVGKNFVEQDIPEWKWIQAQVALSNVSDRVHFITDIPSDGAPILSTLYLNALCYIQPSLYEGFGLPILEALQVGTIPIAAKLASLPEIGGDSVEWVTEPAAEIMAAKVLEIADWSIAKRERQIQFGQRWARKFNWQTTVENTIKIYQQVTQRKKQ